MLYSLLYILLQPDVSGGRVAPSPGGGDPVSGPLGKRAKEHDAMMGALKKGDIVRTNGGIRGEITALDERDVTVEVADRTRIKVLRSHIAGLDQPPEPKS
ncbi:MAG: preprotein translocase subunit YajC [Deltaproteobacteria bacterium]|nr:preprotein translocase subunit YajC [Deltaproteobacteria bacterium]